MPRLIQVGFNLLFHLHRKYLDKCIKFGTSKLCTKILTSSSGTRRELSSQPIKLMKNQLIQFTARSRVLLQRLVRRLSAFAWQEEIRIYASPERVNVEAAAIVNELVEADVIMGSTRSQREYKEQDRRRLRAYDRMHKLLPEAHKGVSWSALPDA